MSNYIEVNYKTYSTVLSALEALKKLPYVLGLDFSRVIIKITVRKLKCLKY